MARVASRRLDIRLPSDHPVFSLPEGERACAARKWLDIGLKYDNLDERLQNIEKTLLRIESMGPGRPDNLKEADGFADMPVFNLKRLEADIISMLG